MKILLLCLFLSLIQLGFSQINIGTNSEMKLNAEKFKPTDLKALKGTTTIFVYRKSDETKLDQMKKAISEAWTYTPLEFVSYDEYLKNKYSEKYSFLTINFDVQFEVGTYGKIVSVAKGYTFLNLWMVKGGKTIDFARIELFVSHKDIMKYKEFGLDGEKEIKKYLYTDAELRNWFLGYLVNSIHIVDSYINKGEVRTIYEKASSESLSKLEKSTLYIPDYILIKLKMSLTKGGNEDLKHDISELMIKYPYKYKVVSTDEITRLILDTDEPIFYFTYVRSTARKFIVIFDGRTGEIIYSTFEDMSYNIDEKDFKEIASEIDQ